MRELQIIDNDKLCITKKIKELKEKKNKLNLIDRKLIGQDCHKVNYFVRNIIKPTLKQFFRNIKDKIFLRVKEEILGTPHEIQNINDISPMRRKFGFFWYYYLLEVHYYINKNPL